MKRSSSLGLRLFTSAFLILFTFAQPLLAVGAFSVGDPLNGSVGVVTDASSDPTWGSWYLRYTGNPAPSSYSHAYQWESPAYVCDPNNTPTTFSGTINVNTMPVGSVSMVGLIDKGLLDIGKTGYQSGAYAYIYRISADSVRIGPSDGNQGGEIVQNFRDYSVSSTNGILYLSMTISAGNITLTVDSDSPISDIYGTKKGTYSYAWNEFSQGAIPGWDNYGSNNMPYNFTVSGCLEMDRTVETPIHISPLDGSYKTTLSQTLIDWTDVTDPSTPVSYLYQSSSSEDLNTDGSFVSPVYTSSPLSISEISTSGTPEGEYYWHVKAIDALGNQSPWTTPWKVTVDNTAPSIPQNLRFSDPVLACGAFTNIGMNTVDWDNSTDNFALDGYDYNIDYPLPTGGRGIWNAFFTNSQYRGTLNEGLHQIKVRAKDKAGNVSDWTSLCDITYDKTAPEISIDGIKYPNSTVVNKFITNYSTPTIVGQILSADTSSIALTVNSQTYLAVLNSGLWEANIADTLLDGTYEMQIVATDQVGNAKTTSQNIIVDTRAPNATHLYFKDGQEILGAEAYVQSVNQLSFTGEYTDANPSSNLYWDSFVIFQAQDDGLFAFSQNGKLAYCSWRQAPNLVTLSGNPFTLTEQRQFTDCIATLSEGTYYMTHQVYDNATRTDIPSINQFRDVLGLKFTVDTSAPVSQFTLNKSNTYNNTDINLQGESTDVNGVTEVNLYYKDISSLNWTLIRMKPNTSNSSTFAWSHTWTPPYEGTFDVKAEATDQAGNIEHSPMMTNIVYDITPPTIGAVDINIDYFGTYVNGKTGFLVSVPVNDILSGIKTNTCSYDINGVPYTGTYSNSTKTCFFFVPSNQLFDDTGVDISATVKDKAGNTVTSGIVSRQVDKNLPTSQTIIDGIYYGPNSLPEIKGTATDTVSNVTNVALSLRRSSDGKYWIAGNLWMNVSTPLHDTSGTDNWTYTQGLPTLRNNVTYTVTPYAWDQVHLGTQAGTPDAFIWDNELPQDPNSFRAYPDANTPTNDNTVEVYFSGASDSMSGVAGFYYSFSNTRETPDLINWLTYDQNKAISEPLADGTWWFNIRTIDNAGNITSTSHYGPFIIDTVAPDVEITAPTSTHLTGIVEIRGTVTDVNPHHYWFVITNSIGTQVAGLGTVNDSTSFTDKFLLNWDTTSLPEGQYTIKLEARDAANNKDSGSVHWLVVTVDHTQPTVDLQLNVYDTGFEAVFSEDVNQAEAENAANYFLNNWPTAGGTGDLLGDASISYDSVTHTATVTFTNGGWYISPEQQWGVQDIHDLAGNILAVTPYTEYSTPMVAPVTTATGIDSLWHNTDVSVTLTCTDVDGSGCYKTYYSLNGSGDVEGNTVIVSDEGLNTITFYSEDMAGNVEALQTSDVVKIDKTNPTAQVLGATTFTTGDNTPRSLALSDNNELAQVCYVIDTNTQTCLPLFGTGYSWNITDLINTLGVGAHTFTYYVVDTAGNISDSDTLPGTNDPYLASITVADVPAVQGVATQRAVFAAAVTTPEAEEILGEQTTEEETTTPENQEEVKGTQDTTEEETSGKPVPWWIYAIGGATLLTFIIFLIARRRRKENEY